MDPHPASDNQPPSQADPVVLLSKMSTPEIIGGTLNTQLTTGEHNFSVEAYGASTSLGNLDTIVSESNGTTVAEPVSSGLAELLSAISTSTEHLRESKELCEQFHPPSNVENLLVFDLEHFVANGDHVDSTARQKDTALKETQRLVSSCIISLLPLCELMIKRGDTDSELGEVSKSVLQSLKLAFYATATLVHLRKEALRSYLTQTPCHTSTKPGTDNDDHSTPLLENKSSVVTQPDMMLDVACDMGDGDYVDDDSDTNTIPYVDDNICTIKEEKLESIADDPLDKTKNKKKGKKQTGKQSSDKKKKPGLDKRKHGSARKTRSSDNKKRPKTNMTDDAAEDPTWEQSDDHDSDQEQPTQDTEIMNASSAAASQHEGEQVTRNKWQKHLLSSKHIRPGVDEIKSETTGSYQCSICGKVVKHLDILKTHMRTHTRREPWKCSQCNVRFHTLYLLRAHMAIHPEAELYKCFQCSKSFCMKRVLNRHMKVHGSRKQQVCPVRGKSIYERHLKGHLKRQTLPPTGEIDKPHKCALCSIRFNTANRLQKHKIVHIITRQTECSFCSKKYPTPSSLRRHVLTHHWAQVGLEMPAVKCTVCDKIIIDVNGTMAKHMKSHSEGKTLTCTKCGKGFKTKPGLNGHLRRHTGEKRFKCETCSKLFYFKSALQIHNRIHTGEKPYQCNVCGKAMNQLSYLHKHLKTHNEKTPHQQNSEGSTSSQPAQIKEKNQICSYCDKRFTDPSSLRRHLRCVHWSELGIAKPAGKKCKICSKLITYSMSSHLKSHSQVRPFSCDQCIMCFRRRSELKSHIRIHNGEKNYKCDVCGKAFLTKSLLEIHNLSHTGEKPHQCSLCGKAYQGVGGLKKHMLSHTGERPHKCLQCGKTYTEPNGLKVHIRSHTGERPYECTECGKTFASKMPLNRHMMIHTGDRPYACSHCVKTFRTSSDLTRHVATHKLV